MSVEADLADQVAQLESKVQRFETLNKKTAKDRDHYKELYLSMLELNRRLEQGLLGQKSERTTGDGGQLALQLLGTLLGDDIPEASTPRPVQAHKRRTPSGRKPLPAELPRVDVEVLPEEVRQEGLEHFERIGEEVSEVVEHRRASLVVVRTTRPKFVRKDRQRMAETQVLVGSPLELPIPRGMAGPGLLANTIVMRFGDHLPAHRQEKIFAREGLELARSTICAWHIELAKELVRPLILAMWADGLSKAPYVCMDATGVLVQANDKCKHGHFWVAIAGELHVLFGFSHRHTGAAVDKLLGGYKGYLVVDAHSVYDHLFKHNEIIEVGCWSHARRYFFKSMLSEPQQAQEALALIGELFRVERKLGNLSSKKRKLVRQAQSKPVVEAFFKWCDQRREHVLDDTPIDKAIGYVTNQHQALCRFLEDGRLPLHNNGSERQLRREAIGRKNWLFIGSEDGAVANTTFVTLLASAQMHGIEPHAYLRDLLCLLPQWPIHRVIELAPAYWEQTLKQQKTQQLLADNVFRRVCLRELEPHPPDG